MVKRPSSTRNSGKKKKRRFDSVHVDIELVQAAISEFEEEQKSEEISEKRQSELKSDRAGTNLKLGNYAAALGDASDSVSLDPGNVIGRVRKALSLLLCKREIEAIGELSLCIVFTRNKHLQDLLIHLKTANAMGISRECEMKCGEGVNEIKDYMILEEERLEESVKSELRAERALLHLKLGNLREAMVDITAALEFNPSSFVFHLRRALILFGQKSDVEAIGELEVCSHVCPENAYIRFLLTKKKDAYYREYIPTEVSRASCEYSNVEISRQIRWYRAGAETVEYSQKLRVLADRAQANRLLKRYDEALSDANAALCEDECNFFALLQKFMVLYRMKRSDYALTQLEICVDVCPRFEKLNILLDNMRKTFKSNSINCLPDEVLLLILEQLSFRDKMSAELVCKRWNKVVKKYAWSSQQTFSSSAFNINRIGKRIERKRWYSLLDRCGRFIREIDLRDFVIERNLWDNLSQTRLQALIIEGVNLSAESLESVSQYLPNIKSVSMGQVVKECFPGLKELFVTCQLESLLIWDAAALADFDFSDIPSSLKFCDFDGSFPIDRLLECSRSNGCKLVGLAAQNHLLNEATCFDSLKWLSVSLRGLTVANTRVLLSCLSNVRSLELKVDGNKVAEIFNAVAEHCRNVEHFGMDIFGCVNKSTFEHFEIDMPNLVSLSIDGSFSGGIQISVLFRKISSYRKLQYFRTTTKIPLDLVCYALRRCPNLNHLGYKLDVRANFDSLYDVLQQLHGRETPGPDDYQKVLHLFFYNGSNWARYNPAAQIPSSPWIKFYEDYMPKKSPIEQRIRFLCFSDYKPSYLRC